MHQIALLIRNHKNSNGRRESDLARADNAAHTAAEMTAMRDTTGAPMRPFFLDRKSVV